MNDSEILLRPVLAGHQVPAEYTEQRIPEFRGNPFIEALPEPYSQGQVMDLLADFPEYDQAQRKWSPEERMICVQRLKHFMQPLPYHVKLEGCFSRIIRDGYTVRNPLAPVFTRQFSMGFKEILARGLNKKGVNITGIRPTASGFAIIGLSGIGKTTAVERTLLLYPQVIQHSSYQGAPFYHNQLVWLKLECPASGSLKVLCLNFFRQVDLVLGTNYYNMHVNSKSNKESLLVPMAQIATLHGLGVLVIDEIQRLKTSKNSGETEMITYLTELINTIGIPVVLVGTYRSTFLFESTFAEARRASDQGDHVISNFRDDVQWRLFIKALWDLQWTQKECPLNDDFYKALYEESQGIPDIAIKLYQNAQWEAIFSGKEEITVDLIRNVAARCLKLLRPLLQAIRVGNLQALKEFDDVKPKWMTLNDYIKNAANPPMIEGKNSDDHLRATEQREYEDTKDELTSFATSLGCTANQAKTIVATLLKEEALGCDLAKLKREIALRVHVLMSKTGDNSQGEAAVQSDSKRTNKKPMYRINETWSCVFDALENKQSVTEALLSKNLIKPPLNELMI